MQIALPAQAEIGSPGFVSPRKSFFGAPQLALTLQPTALLVKPIQDCKLGVTLTSTVTLFLVLTIRHGCQCLEDGSFGSGAASECFKAGTMVGKTACLITRSSLLGGNDLRQLASSFCQKGAERAAHVAARRLKCSPSGISDIGHVSIKAFTVGKRWHWNEEMANESLIPSPSEGLVKSVLVWTSQRDRRIAGR